MPAILIRIFRKVEELAQRDPLVIISNKEKDNTVDAINQDNTMVGRLMASTFWIWDTEMWHLSPAADQKAVAAFQKNRWFCKEYEKKGLADM